MTLENGIMEARGLGRHGSCMVFRLSAILQSIHDDFFFCIDHQWGTIKPLIM